MNIVGLIFIPILFILIWATYRYVRFYIEHLEEIIMAVGIILLFESFIIIILVKFLEWVLI